MKKNYKIDAVLAIILILFAFIIISMIANAPYIYADPSITSSNDYARIVDLDYKGILIDDESEGNKMLVTERITFDVHAAHAYNLFWELWRDLPESTSDGVPVKYNVLSVKRILDNGSSYEFTESPKLYWYDSDFTKAPYGPGKWFHSEGPYDELARQYECLLFYVDGIYREKVTFEIEYEMTNPAFKYNDCSELYLTFFSGVSTNFLESFNAEILIPDKDMPREGNYLAATFGTNTDTFPYTQSKIKNPGYTTFSINLGPNDLQFKNYNQYIEFDLISYGNDKHILTNHAPNNIHTHKNVLDELIEENEYYLNLSSSFLVRKIIVLVFCISVGIYSLYYAYKFKKKLRTTHNLYKPEIPFTLFREIPSNLDPIFAATLAFCKIGKKVNMKDIYSSLMLSLVRKKYIELSKVNPNKSWTKKNTLITITKNSQKVYLYENREKYKKYIKKNKLTLLPKKQYELLSKNFESLTYCEAAYFNLISRHAKDKKLTMQELQDRLSKDYSRTNSFVLQMQNAATKIGTSTKHLQISDYTKLTENLEAHALVFFVLGLLSIFGFNALSRPSSVGLAFGGFYILGILFILSSLYLLYSSKNFLLLSQFGENEQVKWYGLYKFMKSRTLMKERTHIELPLWEKYLVYSTAFGISKKVRKVLKITHPEIDYSPLLNTSYIKARTFYSSGHVIARGSIGAYRTASHVSFSSYGGGRGGGGGRRWSLKFVLFYFHFYLFNIYLY